MSGDGGDPIGRSTSQISRLTSKILCSMLCHLPCLLNLCTAPTLELSLCNGRWRFRRRTKVAFHVSARKGEYVVWLNAHRNLSRTLTKWLHVSSNLFLKELDPVRTPYFCIGHTPIICQTRRGASYPPPHGTAAWKCLILRRDQGPRTRDQGSMDQRPEARDQGPGTKDQGPGPRTRDQSPGTRVRGPGTGDQG